MEESEVIVKVRNHRHDRNMVSISAHSKGYKKNLILTVMFSYHMKDMSLLD
jgi:hypothetical protein